MATANSLQANGYAANRILGHAAGSSTAQSTIVATANSLQANGYAANRILGHAAGSSNNCVRPL